ncbi:unnamed protein product [Auanema sp. JU1783]|nr:unnamed protein product [Auanema sp. JU1783]
MYESESDDSWTPPPISDVWVNEDIIDTDEFVPELEQQAISLTLSVFKNIEREYRDVVLKDAYDNFKNSMRSRSCRKEYKCPGSLMSVPTPLMPYTPSRREMYRLKPTTVEVETRGVFEIQKCFPIHIQTSPILPRMKYWVHSEKNHEAPDNLRLSHIPHITDDLDDREFVTDLRNMYSEGIHGADRGCEKYINDYMLYVLLKEMHNLWKLEKFYIYIAVFKLFPNKYTYTQFQDGMFLTLQDRFEKLDVRLAPHSMDLVQSLFCEDCMEYDCLVHISEPPPKLGSQRPNVVSGVEPKHLCSHWCYKTLPELDLLQDLRFNDSFALQTLSNLLSAKQHVFCRVANIMNKICAERAISSKTCAQWYRISNTVRGIHDNNNNKINNHHNHNHRSLVYNTNPKRSISKSVLFKSAAHRREHYRVFCRNMNKVDFPNKMNPCNHAGKCDSDPNCECYKNGLACFKHCSCDLDCVVKMPGCSCGPGCCSSTNCWCFKANFECDPDICLSCNCDLTRPKSGYSFCKNIGIQLGLKKDIEIGLSQISGWGIFIRGTANKGDLISEYTGEVVSQSEGERRGRIYDKLSLSYVFDLNLDESVDAGRFGNLIRFANHSESKPNCETLIKIVNGRQRIGIYAKRAIHDGEELVFDYGYKEENKLFVPIEIEIADPSKKYKKKKTSGDRGNVKKGQKKNGNRK